MDDTYVVLGDFGEAELLITQVIRVDHSLSRVLIHVRLQLHLLLIHFYLVAVVVLHLAGQAVDYLVFFYVQAPLIHFSPANRCEFNLWCGPVSEDVICLVKQVVEVVEVALNCHFHLVALGYLLPRNRFLFVRNFQNRAMMLSETSLLAKSALTSHVVGTVLLVILVADLSVISLGIACHPVLA